MLNDQVLPPFPAYFTIETVKACNARCVFCTINSWPSHKPFMDDELFTKISAEIIRHASEVQQVCLNGSGEPLLDKKIADRINVFKRGRINKVILTTNASLLDSKKAEALLDAGLDELLISFNGLDKEKYESLRIGLSFETVMKNTLDFISLRNAKRSKTRIRLRMEAHQLFSNDEVMAWISFWQSRLDQEDQVYAKKLHNWGTQLPGIDVGNISEIKCHVLWSTMNILSDGAVALCCVDYEPKYPLGLLSDSSIDAVWHGEHACRIRNLHASGKRSSIPLCSLCTVWEEDQKIEMSNSQKGNQ